MNVFIFRKDTRLFRERKNEGEESPSESFVIFRGWIKPRL